MAWCKPGGGRTLAVRQLPAVKQAPRLEVKRHMMWVLRLDRDRNLQGNVENLLLLLCDIPFFALSKLRIVMPIQYFLTGQYREVLRKHLVYYKNNINITIIAVIAYFPIKFKFSRKVFYMTVSKFFTYYFNLMFLYLIVELLT